MTTPVIAEFRRLFPEERLTVVVQGPAQAALMGQLPLVDQVLHVPHASDRRAQFKFYLSLRRQGIDVAFLATRITGLVPWALRVVSGVPIIVGDSAKFPFLYKVANTVDPAVHRVDRMLKTFSMWSGAAPQARPVFPIRISEDALKEADAALTVAGLLPGKFLVLHPGSSTLAGTEKRIPADVARRVAAKILELRPDLSVAYIFGPDEEDYMTSFAGLGPRQAILCGLSLSTTVGVLSRSEGFIGSDSSLGHFAAALNVPTITLFGPTIPTETIPYGPNSRGISRSERLACQPCWGTSMYGNCPFGVRCMNELPELEIVKAALEWGRGEAT